MSLFIRVEFIEIRRSSVIRGRHFWMSSVNDPCLRMGHFSAGFANFYKCSALDGLYAHSLVDTRGCRYGPVWALIGCLSLFSGLEC